MKHIFRFGDKPLDYGYGGLSVSLTHTGRIMALNHYHPRHGYVTLTTAPPFPDEMRYDPARVREYRRDLVTQDGFGIELPSDVTQTQVKYNKYDNLILNMTLANGVRARCLTYSNRSNLVQEWKFSKAITFQMTGRMWLMRCPYPQLTEGGVLAPISHKSIVEDDEVFSTWLVIKNTDLNSAVSIRQNIPIIPDDEGAILIKDNERLSGIYAMYKFILSVNRPIEEFGKHEWFGGYYFFENKNNPLKILDDPLAGEKDYPDDPLHTRAWRYARLCATPTEHNTLCILTDHMILPLSWNRDSYYAARLFLDDPQSAILTQKHLLWLFETAERINGVWGRSYLANGKIKDRGFQLDQQLFPLLELAEYVQITGDTALLDRLRPHIRPVFEALRVHRAPHALLYATEETPADDPIALPYPLSSHILLWRVLSELEKIGCGDLADLSPNEIYQSIMTYFIATPPKGDTPLFAYATDGAGKHHFYHDANDVPLALMPAWGFCPANDPVWRATMNFAFSPANSGGFYDGSLGSVHTPAPWALGEIQEWIFARAIGDELREKTVLQRLHQSAQWDGALSEAYDAKTGAVVSRHWFLWTNVFYACVKRGVFDL